MQKSDKRYATCVQVLEEELLPAMGCTEPIAIAYGAAAAREELGGIPDRVVIEASGNIIKNVKSVIVPNTGHLKGIPSAAAAGIIAGKAEKKLEVLSEVTKEEQEQMKAYIQQHDIQVKVADSPYTFDIIVTEYKGDSWVKIRIAKYHTNIVLIEKDGKVILEHPISEDGSDGLADRTLLSVETILEFAESVEIEVVCPLLDRQIQYNTAISEEGMKNPYGASIGRVLLKNYGDDVKNRAKAKAAAGSDARMNGCEMPVVINSGSGNQGITVSVPVVEYARELKVSQEKLYRALVVANLIAIHQKTGIGRLSAYCGAVSAGAGAGCGIAYLYGGGLEEISHTLVNAVAIVSGMVCDGAKASCAAKIATAVDAGIMGFLMNREGQQFEGGDGIVTKGVEETIVNVGRLGRDGMKETDREILDIMINS